MLADCGCRCKSYRVKQCIWCKEWFCPACYYEHIQSLEIFCNKYQEVKQCLTESKPEETRKR